VLRFANEVEDEGNEWPDTDTIGAEGWHYQLRAIARDHGNRGRGLDRGREGGAVMNNEISEEAKQALANVHLRQASQRLRRDGSGSAVAVRRRIRCFAAEWKIPADEFAPLMKGRVPSFNRIVKFCEKHGASIDWIIGGQLKYLQQMKQNVQAAAAINNPGSLDTRILDLGKSFLALPPEKRQFALALVQQLMLTGSVLNA
jgi:hypothetical protein